MIINGVELEDLDIFDIEVAEKYETELNTVIKNVSELKGLTFAESMKKQCNLIFNFFNNLFGEGTDKRIFGDKMNLMTCLKAFEEIIETTNEQKKDLDKIANKYSSNRAARRSKK